MKTSSLILAGVLASVSAQNSVPTFTSCGLPNSDTKWNNLTFTPSTVVLGDNLYFNASGITNSIVSGGGGSIIATIDGMQAFNSQILSCGPQQISVMGIETVYFNGLNCPTTAGSPVEMSVWLNVPTMAAGIGNVNVIAQSNDQSGNQAWCFNISLTL